MTPNARLRSLHQRGSLAARPRLFALLAEPRPVTLISAPAGYGKTVLVESWLAAHPAPHLWLTLHERHREPGRFLADLAAAARLLPAPGDATAAANCADGQTPAGQLLETLHSLPAPTIVVLDDCHVLDRSETETLINRLLRRLPRSLRLVLITRRDGLPALNSLRAHGMLTEVHTNALRFTEGETAALLAQTPGAPSDGATVARLLEATEGWITGMLLAIPHLRDGAALGPALARLQQGNPHILEYLTVEVLDREPPDVQEFLIKTSILDRLHPALCAALLDFTDDVTDKEQAHLRILREHSLFVHEVEGSEGWLRYARLFQQGLRVHLHGRYGPAVIADLHRRASAWFAAGGMIDEALRHAVAADDTPHAIRLVAQRRHDLMNGEEWGTLQRWLGYFDRATRADSPDLALAEAWLLLNEGRVQELEPLLARIDRLLAAAEAPAVAPVATPASELRTEIDALRCQCRLVALQPQEVIREAPKTVAALPVAWQLARSYVLFSQAAALQMAGDLAQANAALDAALIWPHSYPSVFHVRVLAAQCQVQWLAADLPAVLAAARQVLLFSEQLHLAQMRTWGAYYLGAVYYQWNELEGAAAVLEPLVQAPAASDAIAFANASCALAATRQAQGRAAEANAVLSAAIEFLRATNRLCLPLVQAFAAELALRRQEAGHAAQLVVQQPVIRTEEPAFHFLAPQLVRPKVLLALGQPAARQEARVLLAAAQTFFAGTHNTRFLVETLVLLAVAHAADGRRVDALAALLAALKLAQPGGLLRAFVDNGVPLLPLLDALARREDAPALAHQLRKLLQAAPPLSVLPLPAPEVSPDAPASLASSNVRLPEPLTARELDVLAALAQHLTSREIADRLGISANTIKHHIGSILGKLDAADRRQAVARGRALGLLSIPPRRA